MPIEWLHVLNMEGIDTIQTLYNLKYKYTVSDVYDLLELKAVKDFYNAEEMRLHQNANR